MTRLAMLVTGLMVMSCSGKGGNADGEGDGAGDGDGACDVEATLEYPASDGSTDVYYRGQVKFSLSDVDNSASISLAEDATGASVAGNSAFDSSTLTVTFTPTGSLAPSTDYTATLGYCTGDVAVSFRTSTLGEDLSDGPEGLIDRTYIVDLTAANFVKPEAIGQLLGSVLEQNILLGVTEATGSALEVIGAISVAGGTDQDFCNPSIQFPETADFSSAPYFQIGPQDTTLSVAGFDVTINQLRISGDFASDGSYFGGGLLMGEIDARDIVDILFDEGLVEDDDPAGVCDLLSTFGVLCESCASDGLELCLSVEVDQIVANENPGQILDIVEDCDPERCTDGCG